jgi:hypothetical protein
MLEYVISGLLTLLVGLLSLFVDPKTDKKRAWWIVGALVLSSSITAGYGYYDSKDSKNNESKMIDVSQGALDEARKLEKSNTSIEANLQTLMRRENIPVSEGDVSGAPAPSEAKAVAESRPIIEYFAKDAEADSITKALRDSGMDVIKLPGQRPGPTNSIWAGNSVTMDEVRPVALALLRAGVQLRSIRHFSDGSGTKARLIEIGSDRQMESAPALTVEHLQNMMQVPPH